jgi:hypothetical protein
LEASSSSIMPTAAAASLSYTNKILSRFLIPRRFEATFPTKSCIRMLNECYKKRLDLTSFGIYSRPPFDVPSN